jgi:hypothetical protein
LPFNPKGALEFLKKAVDRVADFGGKSLYGCTYCNLGTLTGAPPTAEEKKTVVDTLGQLHGYAKTKKVQIGIEPVNRYETIFAIPARTPRNSSKLSARTTSSSISILIT